MNKREKLIERINECGIDGGESTSEAIENLDAFDRAAARLKALTSLIMVNDPWPTGNNAPDKNAIFDLADELADALGFAGGWVEAYHKL